uniref:HTH cro/C1-type domain-containing protein n=1 Tax=Mastacembelus armatus TaxID=205130 RepID=A0A3Q3MSS0_9TELE
MRPRRHLTIDQRYLARLQTGVSQREVATEIGVSQSVISRLRQRYRETGRVTERHRSGRPLATSCADHRLIVNSALRNRMMNATQLQAHLSLTTCKVLFSDESRFTLSRNDGRQRCWRHQGERYASATVVTRRARGKPNAIRCMGKATSQLNLSIIPM